MKFEVYNAPKKDDKTVRFMLRVDGAGDLTLCAVNEEGGLISNILWIMSDTGKLRLCEGVDDETGLNLDDDDKLVMEDD